MKNALILTAVWLGILVAAYTILFWDQGIDRRLPISILEQQVESTQPEYVHPDGLFSVPIPLGWHMQQALEYVQMTDPDENIMVWVVAMEAMDLDVCLNQAFAVAAIGPEFSTTSDGMPADDWIGEDISLIYFRTSDDIIVSVRVKRPDQWTIAMVAVGPEHAIEAVSGNLEWIWSQLEIPANQLHLL